MIDSALSSQPLDEYSTYTSPETCKQLTFRFGSEGFPQQTLVPKDASIYSMHNIDVFNKQGPLPRPYDPVDNIRMTLPYTYGAPTNFGKRTKKIVKKSNKKNPVIKSKRSFGTTPGTDAWDSQRNLIRNDPPPDPPLFFEGPTSQQDISMLSNLNKIANVNVPMNYSNNVYNLQNYPSTSQSTMVPNPSTIQNKFGKMSNQTITGPNTFLDKPLLDYHGGGTTINWLTGEGYPNGNMINGPTNTTGYYSNLGTKGNTIYNVQQTPRDYLVQNSHNGSAFGSASEGLYAPAVVPSPFKVNFPPKSRYLFGKKKSQSKSKMVSKQSKSTKTTKSKLSQRKERPRLTKLSSKGLKPVLRTTHNNLVIEFHKSGKTNIKRV